MLEPVFITLVVIFVVYLLYQRKKRKEQQMGEELDDLIIYYDKENNKLFERNELTIRYIVFYSIIYLCSFIWLYIIIKKNYKNKYQTNLELM
jgi:prolipoprotein diacylglyceryltransferase